MNKKNMQRGASKSSPRSVPRRKNLNFEDDDFLFSDSVRTSARINRKGRKNEYIIFYALAAVISISVLVILTTVFLNQFGASQNGPSVVIPPINDVDDYYELGVGVETETLLGLITNIDYTNSVLVVRNLETGTPSNFVIQNSSDLRGRLGNALILEQLNIGDIVEIDYLRTSVVRLTVSPDAWEQRAVTGVSVISSNEINVSGEIFAFNSDILVLNNGNIYNIDNLSTLNQVNIRGLDRTVWFIEISGGFGAMQVINSSGVINGSLHIDGSTIELGYSINPLDQIIDLSEGMHNAVIHGDNINTERREVHIRANETTILDLSNIELTSGNLLVNLNTPEGTVFINGIQRNIEYPILLQFGTHAISVIAPGFANYERPFEFEFNNQTIHIALTSVQTTEPPLGEFPGGVNQNGANQNQANQNEGDGHQVGGFPQTGPPQAANSARVDIRSVPSGASLFVDDILVGTTPFTGNLPVGTRSIRFQMPNFINTGDVIEVLAGNNAPLTYELQPLPSLPQPGFPPPPPVEHTPPAIEPPPLSELPPLREPEEVSPPVSPPPVEPEPPQNMPTIPPSGMPDPSLPAPTIPQGEGDLTEMPVMPGFSDEDDN